MSNLIQHLKKTKWQSYLVFFLSCTLYINFSYHTVREDFLSVLLQYSLLFFGFLYLYIKESSLKTLLFFGVIFRLLMIVATPNLSNDFYRFIWDGRALWNNINPYLILPEHNPNLLIDGNELYKGMGTMNGSHYTCYPPLNQYAFWLTNIFGNHAIVINTIIMRLMMIVSDLIIVHFGIQLLHHFKYNPKRILLYFINPFIILELTGNLHFEGLMIAFIIASFYYVIVKKHHLIAGALLGLSVSVKLIPLIFVPLFLKHLSFKNFLKFGIAVAIINILLFMPFASQALYDNFMSSIELYFQNFEFNASIYYIIREIGYHVKGYNIIKSVGKITPLIVIAITLYISFVKKNQQKEILFTSMLAIIVSYYLLSSIVHPWYIAIPLILSVFTKYYFPLVWSFCIILSYSAYQNSSYHENLVLVGIEYVIVISTLVVEVFFPQFIIALKDRYYLKK